MFFENNYLSQPHKHPGARTEEDLEILAREHWDSPEYAKQRRMYEAQEEKQRARYNAEEGGSRAGGGGYDIGHAVGRRQVSPRAGGGGGGRTLQPKVERDDDDDDGGVGGGRGRGRDRDEYEMEREEMEGAEKGASRDEDVEMADSGPGHSGGFTSING